MISMMSKDYCYESGYEIQPLEHLVPIEGSGGASIPYLGYVGVRMCIPDINSFDRDVLMFISSTTTQYHQRVPIQVGSHVINQVTSCISEKELQSLSQSWKTAYVSTIISKATSVVNEGVTIPASQTTVVKGLTMITGHHKCIQVLMESSHNCMNVFVLGNTSELKPGNSDIEVVIQNRSDRDLKLKPGTGIGTVIATNIVPTMHVSNDLDVDGQERMSSMLAQVESTNLLGETPNVSNDMKDILQKLNLSGMEEWEPQEQQAAQDLICEFACIFSQDDLDLGKLLLSNIPLR